MSNHSALLAQCQEGIILRRRYAEQAATGHLCICVVHIAGMVGAELVRIAIVLVPLARQLRIRGEHISHREALIPPPTGLEGVPIPLVELVLQPLGAGRRLHGRDAGYFRGQLGTLLGLLFPRNGHVYGRIGAGDHSHRDDGNAQIGDAGAGAAPPLGLLALVLALVCPSLELLEEWVHCVGLWEVVQRVELNLRYLLATHDREDSRFGHIRGHVELYLLAVVEGDQVVFLARVGSSVETRLLESLPHRARIL
mmetsp:Transcript_5744/g.12646  ORF Transcript_5744/g.12646 Transcript_5744/m.12646 type:complete len:253 (+) Transcript_5744:307-1065(+)